MRVAIRFTILALALAAAPWALAESAEEAPLGELHVTMNAAFAKVEVDGSDWGSVEFEANGKRALIKNLDLTHERIEVTLTPVEAGLGPVTLEVKPSDFKRKRIKKLYYMIATRTVKFPKQKVDEPRPETKPEEDPDEIPKVLPGEDDDDL